MTHHLTSRHDLIMWLSEHAPNTAVRRALDRGATIHHGLFKGGWVVSATYGGQTWVVGIRPVGVPPRLTCGLLSGVPVDEYVGGNGVLARGDER
jgi:hypothetical protein